MQYYMFHFQYPPSGSSRCNTSSQLASMVMNGSFSTLQAGRVAATITRLPLSSLSSALSVPSRRVESLQPPSSMSRSSKPVLSVPSRRVESLQRYHPQGSGSSGTHFQYPPGGSSRCNIDVEAHELEVLNFQYPPGGSSRCNPCATRNTTSVEDTFSTLQAGRVAATRDTQEVCRAA